jgi:uridine kinase
MTCFIIGVAGGSGSGKSTVTEHIINNIGSDKVATFNQDYYYKDLSYLPIEQRKLINFDHPDAFDWDLIKLHFNQLYNGLPIEMPTYDYANYTRKTETITVWPSQVVVFEGIFSLLDQELREKMSLKIFVDTAADIRFIRRLERDIATRGRDVKTVIKQYIEFVRPMHKKFIEPTKRYAHIIIPHGANKAALEMIVARIHVVLNNNGAILTNDYFDEE